MSKILIVDDDSFVSRVYGRAFRAAGYETEFANDGEMALKNLTNSLVPPQAIIMDVMMPNMEGADLLKKIKENPSLRNIPTIVLTNLFREDEKGKFMSLGADLYLIKVENSLKDIVKKVGDIISNKIVPQINNQS